MLLRRSGVLRVARWLSTARTGMCGWMGLAAKQELHQLWFKPCKYGLNHHITKVGLNQKKLVYPKLYRVYTGVNHLRNFESSV